MRLTIAAIGRMKAGPERELADRYLDRLKKAGPSVGLEFLGVSEHAESRLKTDRERKAEEAAKLVSGLQTDTAIVVFDERGTSVFSEDFAAILARHRDGGRRDLAFVIGGPDGHETEFRDRAETVLSLGKMTFPHQIARILVAEQLYRAVTILAGHPYHRS